MNVSRYLHSKRNRLFRLCWRTVRETEDWRPKTKDQRQKTLLIELNEMTVNTLTMCERTTEEQAVYTPSSRWDESLYLSSHCIFLRFQVPCASKKPKCLVHSTRHESCSVHSSNCSVQLMRIRGICAKCSALQAYAPNSQVFTRQASSPQLPKLKPLVRSEALRRGRRVDGKVGRREGGKAERRDGEVKGVG